MPRPERPTIVSIRVESVLDENPDLSFYGEYGGSCTTNNCIDRQERGDRGRGELRYFNPATEYGELDYERSEAYNAGLWQMVGIVSEAKIRTPSGMEQTIYGGSVFGIESDSDTLYFNQEADSMLSELQYELKAFGFTDAEIEAVEVDDSGVDAYLTRPYTPRVGSRSAVEAAEIERRQHRKSALANVRVAPHYKHQRRP